MQFTAQFGDQVMQIERDVADMKAIAAVPKMIAELKECRGREAELLQALHIIEADLGEGIKQGSIPIASVKDLV